MSDIPSVGHSRCTEVDQPPKGIFLQEQVRRGPLLISVVTDGYDGEIPGQRAAPNLYLSDELE